MNDIQSDIRLKMDRCLLNARNQKGKQFGITKGRSLKNPTQWNWDNKIYNNYIYFCA